MTNPDNQSSQQPFDLVLNTWLITYLYGGHPGGFPADFLTRSASLLLIFDNVLCDQDALDADIPFQKVWLSSAIFAELKKEGLLKPINMGTYMPQDFWNHLKDTGLQNAALKIMEQEIATLKKTDKLSKKHLELPPSLTWLNHYMFLGLDIPNSLLYEWQENHFKLKPIKLPQRNQLPEESLGLKINQGQQLISVVRALLPEFILFPPVIPDTEAAAYLQRNIEREKKALYRWIYGDPEMPQSKYQDFRLNPSFTTLDFKIDEPRRAIAWNNFELLMKVRSETADIRAGVQKIISDVVNERRTIEDVKTELIEHQQELLLHLPSKQTVKIDVGLAAVGLAISVAGSLSGLVPIAAAGAAITAVDLIKSANEVWENRKKRYEYLTLRNKYPLAFLLRDFNEIKIKQYEELMPKKRRRKTIF